MNKTRQRRSKTGAPPAAAAPATLEHRILILAPSGNDARLTAEFLAGEDISTLTYQTVPALCDGVLQGCGGVLLAEETLAHDSISRLVDTLAQQPPWSDIPIIIIASGGVASKIQLLRLGIFGPHGNVTVLERPFRPGTLVSTVEVALRARRRQYEARDLIQATRESESRYKQLVNSLPAAVYTTDARGKLMLFNEAAASLWGRRPVPGKDEWCGSHRIFRTDGTPLPLDECPMAVTLRKGRAVPGEEVIVERPDGSRRNVVPYPDPIRDASGRLVGAVNMLLDITENKRGEEAFRRLAAIVESSEDAIVSLDLNGIITTWNVSAERLFGYRPKKIVGRPVTVLMPPERWNEGPSILQRIRNGERVEHYETVRRRKDGSLMEISLTVSPIRDGHGKIIGASKIIRDITSQKQARRDLVQAHKEVLTASRAKDDFLAALSHELRTPLNPVLLLASEAAQDPELPEAVRARFRLISNGVELEARLIDDLLDLTRITHGKLLLDLGLVDIHSVLKDALATIRSELDHKRIILALDLAAQKTFVKGDSARLQQIFWNLLRNAVKFTPENGKITLETLPQNDAGEIVIKVTDTGIGMTEPELARIFEAFAQGEHAREAGAHRFGGLGLGLAISRKVVDLHGGKIQALSAGRGRGAAVIVSLPLTTELPELKRPPQQAGPSPVDTSFVNGHRLRILVVEDHEPTRSALVHLLTRRHYDVTVAGSVSEARELCRHQKFQLLISDIGLPDGSGFDLMLEMWINDRDLRGIALTGYGMEQDVARSRAAGFTVHLTKPVGVQSLENALVAAMETAA